MSAEDVTQRLIELEARWLPYGGRSRMRLRPGLTDKRMDDLVDAIDYELDEEQRALWRWADGTDASSNALPHRLGAGQVFPGVSLLPLNLAVTEYQRVIKLNRDDLTIWPKNWLQLNDDELPSVSVATGTDRTKVSRFDPESGTEPRLQSLSQMVDVWLWFWDTFDVRPIDDPPYWSGPWPSLPSEIGTLGVFGW